MNSKTYLKFSMQLVILTLILTLMILQKPFRQFIVALVGGILNILVMASNGLRMPVKIPRQIEDFESPTHFTYKNKNKTKLWFLSDIFILMTPNLKRTIHISIGDILIFLGIISGIIGVYLR